MPYFPESIMPSNIKDESQDIKGNPYIISAADYNKHDQEIQAIEKYINPSPPNYSLGFSGTGCGISSFSGFSGYYYPVPSGFSGNNNLDKISYVMSVLEDVRDNTMFVTSGIIVIKDPAIPAADGIIQWPSGWSSYITKLSEDMYDDTIDDEQIVPELDSLTLEDVYGMPDSGQITVINPISSIWSDIGGFKDNFMAYGNQGEILPPENDTDSNKSLLYRRLSMGTNVEIMNYLGIDRINNRILHVSRKSQGTMCWKHKTGDLVFKGELSIFVSPFMYISDNEGFNNLECYISPLGKVTLKTRSYNYINGDRIENESHAYASYQAILIRSSIVASLPCPSNPIKSPSIPKKPSCSDSNFVKGIT